jgi:hypothetical protein
MRERSNLQRKNLLKCTLALLGRDRQLSVLMRQRDLHKQVGAEFDCGTPAPCDNFIIISF